MKDQETIGEAISIGNDSYELQHFEQLPTNASKKKQIEALKRDINWQRNHVEYICGRIDSLISKLEV